LRGNLTPTASKEPAVTAVTPHDATHSEIEEEIRQAWSVYHEELRELRGAEYEAAEDERWTDLQDELKRIEQRRSEPVGSPS
jgi:hypothetical protein